jgi:ribosomal protein S18 acetylase RimI-like enzyme
MQAPAPHAQLPHITRLDADHAPIYRALMLEAYQLAADAFTSTAEERQAEPMSWWVRRIAVPSGLNLAFGAFDDQDGGRLVGTVGLEFSAKPKTRHSALVLGMYVTPDARGRGLAVRLMQAAVAEARSRPGLRSLTLTVTEGNEAAIGLYRSIGFVAWGVEPEAILTPSGFKGKVYMNLDLAPGRVPSPVA